MQTSMMKSSTHRIVHLTLAALVGLGGWISTAQAQVARVAEVQRVVERRTGDAGAWSKANAGTTLTANDRVRTGKRSKADVKFTDGSLLRLGPLSSVTIEGTNVARVAGGQVMAVRLTAGRVLAGSAVAEIKGSVVIIRYNDDGSATFELHSGDVDIVTPRGRVNLRPGKAVTARADGSLTTLFNIPPLLYEGGTLQPELTREPQRGQVFAGSPTNVIERIQPSRLAVDENRPVTQNPAIIRDNSPYSPPGSDPHTRPTPSPGTGSPFPTPFPTGPSPVPTPFPTLPPQSFSRVAKGAYVPSGVASSASFVRQARQVGGMSASELQTAAAAQQAADAATNHFEESANAAYGNGSGGDVMLIGALTGGNGQGQAYGGRFHAFSADGHWFLDLAATPLKLRFKAPGAAGYTTTDLSSISSASLTYRHTRGEFQIGRQRFIQGPTQAAVFGSLLRQGAREVMDAARFAPNIGNNWNLELAYIYDAFPRNLPYRVGGAQRGWYSRLATQTSFGNFGLNLLNYRNAPIASTTGMTVDFALPLLRNQVELYGEFGRDTFRRRLTTAGLTFPGLYDRTDIDLYLEYARLRGSSTVAGPPNELALRAYRRFGKNLNLVAGISKFKGFSTSYTVGVSLGKTVGREGNY